MPTFDHLETAQTVRDVVKRIAGDVVGQMAPGPRFGRVISADFVAMMATVWFPGDPDPVPVKMFSSVLPGQWQEKYAGVGSGLDSTSLVGFGSRVAVETIDGTQYITQVLNGGQFSVDFNSAGFQQSPYGIDGVPEDPNSGDYVFHVHWDTWGSPPAIAPLPNNGGPFAINIGPFSINMNQLPLNSTHEIEVIGTNGQTQRYAFNTNAYQQLQKNFFGSIDTSGRWMRVIPTATDEIDDYSTNGSPPINKRSSFTLPGQGADTAGDWTGGTGTNAAYSSDNDGTLRVWSQSGTQNILEAVTNVTGKYQVVGGAKYATNCNVISNLAWASGIRQSVNWYTSAGVLISTSNGPTSAALTANSWIFGYSANFTAPSNAAYGVWKLNVMGTPPINQSFYFDNIEFRSADPATKNDFSLDFAIRNTIHGSIDEDPNHSYNELWIRIYVHWLNATVDPHWIVRVRNTAGWSTCKSTKTGKPAYEYITNPTDAVGYLGYHDSNVAYTSNPTQYESGSSALWSPGTWRNPDLTLANRAQEVLTGGGVVTFTGGKLKWTQPFEVGGIGRSRHGLMVSTASISMPTSGQIPIFPAGTLTAPLDATGIPLTPGQSLWFGIPPGLASGTIPNAAYFGGGLHGAGGLFIADSSSLTIWSPPEWAVLVAYRASSGVYPEIKMGTGSKVSSQRIYTELRDDSSSASTTSTTYVGVSPFMNLDFIALSDQVAVTVGALISNGGATGPWNFFATYQISQNSNGAIIVAAIDGNSAQYQSAVNTGGYSEKTTIVSDLTVGASYRVSFLAKSSSGTGLYRNRLLAVRQSFT